MNLVVAALSYLNSFADFEVSFRTLFQGIKNFIPKSHELVCYFFTLVFDLAA